MYQSLCKAVPIVFVVSHANISQKTFILYSLMSAPIIWRDYSDEFDVHFISLFVLSTSSAHTKKLSVYI